MTLIDDLAGEANKDASDLIVHRLGIETVRKIEAEIAADETETDTPDVTRFYQRCLSEMEPITKTVALTSKPPNSAWAWSEVVQERGNILAPSFSHPMIVEAIKHFGGWSKMWAEFNDVKQVTQRKRFTSAYEELTGER